MPPSPPAPPLPISPALPPLPPCWEPLPPPLSIPAAPPSPRRRQRADPGVTTGAAVAVYQAAVAAMCARTPVAGNPGSLRQPAGTAGTPVAEQSDRIPAHAAGAGQAARGCAEIGTTRATGTAVAE